MSIYVLGPFCLDTRDDVLLRGTEVLPLGRRAARLLRTLVERPGALVSKSALIEAAWPGQAIEDSNLTVQIAALRRAFAKEPGGYGWIETLPRRGYRFMGPIATREPDCTVAEPTKPRAPHDTALPRNSQGERRPITTLSCELVVPAAAGGLDLEDIHSAIADFHRCVSDVASRHQGVIYRYLGNHVLVLFGYLEAHEHDAEHAVRAGLGLCAAVRSVTSGADAPMRCRIGIATGLVIVAGTTGELQDQEIVGDAPNRATRLLVAAPPDTVAVDPETRSLIGNLFDCREFGAIEIAGRSEPVRVWQVIGESNIPSRFEALRGPMLSSLIGRDEEIDLLSRRWQRAKATCGQIVLVSGEPGVGKSRIVAALEERLSPTSYHCLRYSCSPYHQDSALFPYIDQLRYTAGFARDDAPAARLEKLEVLLAGTEAPDEDLAFLADLLGLPASARYPLLNSSPQRKKERTLEALIRRLERLARRQPLLMVFEDAHWADPTSLELLDLTIDRIRDLQALLIVTFRPEYQPPWAGQARVTTLTLNQLDRRDQIALIRQITGGKALPDAVVDQIAEHTDGVPLFIEEVTKGVLDSGLLREQTNCYVLDRKLPPLAIPTTLQASLLARLDRLASARRVAQIGAAIGRRFSYRLLRAVSDLSADEIQTALGQLVACELVFERGKPPDSIYSFKHALVQDAARSSLLRQQKRQLHARIAETLEADSFEATEIPPELLALHYAEAGLVAKSVAYWHKASEASTARSAMAEAAVLLQKGLDQLALLPDTQERQRQELELRSSLGAVLTAGKGHGAPEAGTAYARARELWERLDFPPEFIHILHGQSRNYLYRGELGLALRVNDDLLRLSRQSNDSAGLVLGHAAFGRDLLVAGRFGLSRSHFEEALRLYNPISHRSLVNQAGFPPQVGSQAYLGMVLCCLGYPLQAIAQSSAAIDEARRLAHSPALAVSLAIAARTLALAREDAALSERAEELVAVATDRGLPLWVTLGTIYRAAVMVQNGDFTEGILLMRRGLEAYRASGTELWMPHFLALVAGATERAGQPQEGLALLDEALQIADRTGERWFAPELSRLKGELLLRQGHAKIAEELCRKALSIAAEQEAKLWELRAAVSLARLWRVQRRRAEARDLLAPIFGWFSEGFAMPDLLEAKTLLDDLCGATCAAEASS